MVGSRLTGMLRRARPITVVLATAALAAALTSCGSASDAGPQDGRTTGPPTSSPTVSSPLDVAGDWQLTQIAVGGGAVPAIPDGTTVTLEFSRDGQASGTTGCNFFAASYTLSELSATPNSPGSPDSAGVAPGGGAPQPQAAIHFGPITSTTMACPGGTVMRFEQTYVQALQSVDGVARNGNQLVLTGSSAKLSYEAVPHVVDTPLAGTTWHLDSLIDGDTVSSTSADSIATALLTLSADGTTRGSTGCSGFLGTYTITGPPAGGVLEVSLSPVPHASCPPNLQHQDEFVRSVLAQRLQTNVDGSALTLTAPDGTGLGYRAEGPTF